MGLLPLPQWDWEGLGEAGCWQSWPLGPEGSAREGHAR